MIALETWDGEMQNSLVMLLTDNEGLLSTSSLPEKKIVVAPVVAGSKYNIVFQAIVFQAISLPRTASGFDLTNYAQALLGQAVGQNTQHYAGEPDSCMGNIQRLRICLLHFLLQISLCSCS